MANSEGVTQIRPATSADVPHILEIEREATTAAHWAESDYANGLTNVSPRRLILLAEQAQRPEGFLVARCAHAAEWEIENVVVAEAARRKGFATSLINTFLERIQAQALASQQAPSVHLEVRESNLAARHLYEKSGFQLDSRRPAYYRQPDEDAILYRFLFQ